jgi:hypothetical protein
LVGTASTHIAIDVPGEIDRLGQSVLSVFAFNHGPAYLVGRDLLAPPYGLAIAAAGGFVAAFAVLMVLAGLVRPPAADTEGAGPRSLLVPVTLAALAAMILVPPILTIRIEQRWLVEPFALLVLMGAWAAGRLAERNRWIAAGLFALWTTASLGVDAAISRDFSNVFFVSASRSVEGVKHDLLDRLPANRKIILLAAPEICGWALQGARFYQVYAPERAPFSCVSKLPQVDEAIHGSITRPDVYAVGLGESPRGVGGLVYADQAYVGETRRIEFLDQFDRGQINDPRPVQTPSGRGVLRFPLDVGNGTSLPGMAVVTGFSYRFDHIPVQPGDRLEFEATMALRTKAPARARVTIAGADGEPVQVFSDLVPVHPASGPPSLVRASIPLDRFGREVSVTFASETPPGVDPSAQWVLYVRPRIAASNTRP